MTGDRDRRLLTYINDSIRLIGRYLSEGGRQAFESDSLIQDAVLRRLETLAEAAGRLSPTVKEGHPEIPWREVYGFRNIAAHEVYVRATGMAPSGDRGARSPATSDSAGSVSRSPGTYTLKWDVGPTSLKSSSPRPRRPTNTNRGVSIDTDTTSTGRGGGRCRPFL